MLLFFSTRAYLFSSDKNRVTFYRPETIVSRFLYLIVLISQCSSIIVKSIYSLNLSLKLPFIYDKMHLYGILHTLHVLHIHSLHVGKNMIFYATRMITFLIFIFSNKFSQRNKLLNARQFICIP